MSISPRQHSPASGASNQIIARQLTLDTPAPVTEPAVVDRLGIPRDGSPVVVSWGAGVDSTAMLVAMKREGVVPDAILFADTGGEKPETYAYVEYLAPWLESWGAPPVTVVRKRPSPRVSYTTLEGNCLDNETLPSLAFGLHSCSIKWKGTVLDQALTGVSRGPNKRPGWQPALEAWASGRKVVKLIGYDAGPADKRRRKRLTREDDRFRWVFPAAGARVGARGMRARHRRGGAPGAAQVGVLLLPGFKALGALVAVRRAS